VRVQLRSCGSKSTAKGPALDLVNLGDSLSGSGESNVDGVSQVMRKIELDGEDGVDGFRKRIAQENGDQSLVGVVIDPCDDGVAALEVDAVQDGVTGFEGLHGVDVEADVVLVGVVEAGVEARVELDGDEGGRGEAERGGEGEVGGGGVGGEEEGEAVAGGGGVEVVDGEGEGGGEGGEGGGWRVEE